MNNTATRILDTAARVALPTGAVVPDLSVKRSLVLTEWNAKIGRAHV